MVKVIEEKASLDTFRTNKPEAQKIIAPTVEKTKAPTVQKVSAPVVRAQKVNRKMSAADLKPLPEKKEALGAEEKVMPEPVKKSEMQITQELETLVEQEPETPVAQEPETPVAQESENG